MKKFLSILFSILLCFTAVQIPVKAENTVINDASISGAPIKPEAGKAEVNCFYTGPVSKMFKVVNQTWLNAKTGTTVGTFDAGMIVEYTAKFEAASGYEFAENCVLTITGIGWNYSESTVSSDRKTLTFTATYAIPYPDKYWTINVKRYPEEGGTVSGATSIKDGEFLNLTAVPAKGYTFSHWMSEGYTLSFENPLKYLPKSDMNIDAVFTKDSAGGAYITAEINPKDGGSISWSSMEIILNEKGDIQAYPAPGFKFVNWTENGKEVSTNPDFVFTADKDRHFVANFAKLQYTLTFKSTAGGSTSVTSKTADYNTDVFVEAKADKGYHFVRWTEGDKEIGKYYQYYFTANKDRTITAVFEKDPDVYYDVFFHVDPEGGGSVEPISGARKEGTKISASATPSKGYYFKEWKEEKDGVVSSNPQYEFTVTKNYNLTAVFAKNSAPTVILNEGKAAELTDPKTVLKGTFTVRIDPNTDKAVIRITPEEGLLFDPSKENVRVTAGDTALSPVFNITDNEFTLEVSGLKEHAGKDLNISYVLTADPAFKGTKDAGVKAEYTLDANDKVEVSSNKITVKIEEADPTPSPSPTPTPTPSPSPANNTVIYILLGVILALLIAIGILLIIRKKHDN